MKRCVWAFLTICLLASPVLADNCSGLTDCQNQVAVWAAIIGGLIVAGIVLWWAWPAIAGLLAASGEGILIAGAELAGEDALVGAFLDGAGPWVAEATNITEGGAVAQSLNGSCVSACGEMLSNGAMSEAQFLAELGEWSNPTALAEALNALEGAGTWTGGYFADAADALAAAEEGEMAAVLQAPGMSAHMVVIEALEDGSFLVRDPAIGGTYEVTAEWIEQYVAGGVW